MQIDKKSLGGFDLLLIGLALIFITLKLTKVIAWSWWWVTAPIWGPFALVILVLLAILLVHIIKK